MERSMTDKANGAGGAQEAAQASGNGGAAGGGKRYLGRDAILAAGDLATEDLYVPEWDAWVRIKTLTGAERDYFEASIIRRNGKIISQNLQNVRARLCALCIVDADGQRVFGEEDEYALGRKSAAALDRIFTAARRLNNLSDADVEELVKN
jgi:hypothetical protein